MSGTNLGPGNLGLLGGASSVDLTQVVIQQQATNRLLAAIQQALTGGLAVSFAVSIPGFHSSTSYANDAAAAAGGVAVDQIYRNGSVLQIRVT
jgi:hypothetical protein